MAKKRPKPPPVDRAVEYIDSPRMIRRLRYGDAISATILGNYGVYRTDVRSGKPQSSLCTCPSEIWPCKHTRALAATWDNHPETFFDVQAWLDSLATRSKADLLKLIGQMVLASPESLSACGFEEFRPLESNDEFD
ncbi:MAG: hypothetical protein SH850_25585 [Planctomycetaceae bacterium]|nr:hypothetical protein [Planctomycetaceae bacterium]